MLQKKKKNKRYISKFQLHLILPTFLFLARFSKNLLLAHSEAANSSIMDERVPFKTAAWKRIGLQYMQMGLLHTQNLIGCSGKPQQMRMRGRAYWDVDKMC